MSPRGAGLILRAASRAAASLAPGAAADGAVAPAVAAAAAASYWLASSFATKASTPSTSRAATAASPAVAKKDWAAVTVPAESAKPPTTVAGGQAFGSDLRSTSGLCMADGITSHTGKWLQGDGPGTKSPMEWIREAEPIEVHAPVVASNGDDGVPGLGCPVEYINLRGTSRDNPAVCKYTGNRYWAPKEYWGGH